MAQLFDVYYDQEIFSNGRQATKFSEEQLEEARLAIEKVVQEEREEAMQQARDQDAAFAEEQRIQKEQQDAADVEVERQWRIDNGHPPIEEIHEQQPP